MSARYRKVETIDEQITHAVSMGLFGACLTTFLEVLAKHYFSLTVDESTQLAFAGASGICGLYGMSLLDELWSKLRAVLRGINPIGWIQSANRQSEKDNEKPSG